MADATNVKPLPKRGEARERLLEAAEAAVLAKGFAATSIDELIAAVGITKSGFFYHFRDKAALARAMLERYLARDIALLEDIFRKGDAADPDPLGGFLAGLELFAATMSDLPANYPGCLAASFAYQDQLFDREVRALNAEGMLIWRRMFRARLDAISAVHPPVQPVDLDALADMVSALVEGGLVLARGIGEPAVLPRQILLYRDYVAMLFPRS